MDALKALQAAVATQAGMLGSCAASQPYALPTLLLLCCAAPSQLLPHGQMAARRPLRAHTSQLL